MGSMIAIGIKNVEVSESSSGNEQSHSVVYTASNNSTCTLRVTADRDHATLSLRDKTFIGEGTRLDVKIHRETNVINGVGVKDADVNYWGDTLQTRALPTGFRMIYGVPKVRIGAVIASGGDTGTSKGRACYVSFLYGSKEQGRIYALVVQIWWDSAHGKFMYTLTGPTQHSTPSEALQVMFKAYATPKDAAPAVAASHSSTTNQQTTNNIGLINNTGGPVNGDLNGSIVYFVQIFQNYMNGS